MNFIKFSVGATNIFPAANTVKGGQLLTEFNLRSRESVDTPSQIKYMVGHSYVHSEDDFMVTNQTDGSGVAINSTAIEISPGRGVINGHYVESLVPIVIDIAEANAEAVANSRPALKGRLCVGLRVMYSTEATMAGAILTEDDDDYYEGIQVVILPKDGELGERFTLPVDSPDDKNKVNAHIKLAEFNYINGTISNISNSTDKIRSISADRLGNVTSLLSDVYVKKTGLNPKRLYTFSGKGTDPSTGLDTWCDSTDSLIVWDENPNLVTGEMPASYPEVAQFVYDPITGRTQLILPHKQVDGMESTDGTPQYFEAAYTSLPLANYSSGTGGTVDSNFIASIKEIDNKIRMFYNLPAGRFRALLDYYDGTTELPGDIVFWNTGDYIIVSSDQTQASSGDARPPVTMYVVLPGLVTGVSYVDPNSSGPIIDFKSEGVCLNTVVVTSAQQADEQALHDPEVAWEYLSSYSRDNNYTQLSRGEIGRDYYEIRYVKLDDQGGIEYISYLYYLVSSVVDGITRQYSNALWLTEQIPLASETAIGGFYNVPNTALGSGYVYLNSEGFLQLLDYDLLVTGVLAYQLGEDFTTPSGISAEEAQADLDEYVNERVAFPNAAQILAKKETGENPNVINITVQLSSEDEEQVINLYNIDSRFNTCVYLHVTGASSNTVINISDCQKIRIDNTIDPSATINLYRSNLYYDSYVLNRLNTIQGLGLWYEKFDEDDPDLIVDGMTVELVGRPQAVSNEEFWTADEPNDNHYSYALRSLTFGSDGSVIRCSLLVTDDMSANVETGSYISVFQFSLPQSIGLPYPASRLIKQLKVTGEFVTAYPVQDPEGYLVKDTSFTALTQAYSQANTNNYISGTISFLTTASLVTTVAGITIGTAIDGWESGKFHVFYGGTAE